MKVLIVTVAGKATRFNRDCRKPTLKCMFTDGNDKSTILARLLRQTRQYDKFVIVGGYLFDELAEYLVTNHREIQEKIVLVYNPHFEDKGSMYSLYMGIEKAKEYDPDEIVFAEGDLIVDDVSIQQVMDSRQDAISVSKEIIWANKAVVAYLDDQEKLHYLFDSNHTRIRFEYDVSAIFNSAQIWKFVRMEKLFNLNECLSEAEKSGTNLQLIQKYFGEKNFNELDCIEIKQWFNCNTVEDYQIGMKQVEMQL